MKSKEKPTSENGTTARPLPVEEFALLVEGLNAADIEDACAQDGAAPGGAPPAWPTLRAMDNLRERALGLLTSVPLARPWMEWDDASACRVVARGAGLSAIGVHDGDEFDIDGDAELNEGDLVAVEGKGRRLLRRLRHVGGARLLCSGKPELPAVALDDELRCLGVASPARRD